MPAKRKTTALGRSATTDRAGRPLASQERTESYCRRAEAAGLDVSDWFREGVDRLFELEKQGMTPDTIDEMRDIEEAMETGLDEAGIPDMAPGRSPLIPRPSILRHLQVRTLANADNATAEPGPRIKASDWKGWGTYHGSAILRDSGKRAVSPDADSSDYHGHFEPNENGHTGRYIPPGKDSAS